MVKLLENKGNMQITPRRINLFMFFKLPLAYIGGVRVKFLSVDASEVKIKYRWMNQNPFKSMFWAAQGMAAEMSTGVLVMKAIKDSNLKVSMLVVHQEARFFKKATGKITFKCTEGSKIREAILKSNETKEGKVVILNSQGKNEEGIVVSSFNFEWSLKVKT